MMTSLQLGQRMMRNLTTRDIGLIDALEQTRVIDAANDALMDYWMALPASLRTEPHNIFLRAPAIAEINATKPLDTYTYVLPVPPTGTDREGASVLVGSDPTLNRIKNVRTFWRPYIGTDGAVNMTVYSDCVTFARSESLQIMKSPEWADTNAQNPLKLCHLPPDHYMRRWAEGDFMSAKSGLAVEVGRPAFWWTEPCHAASLTAPMWALRLWPLPATDGVLSFTMAAPAPVLQFVDFSIDRALPVEDAYASSVYALAIAGMVSSPLWDTSIDKNLAISAAQQAKQRLMLLSSPQHSEPTRAGTPREW